VRNLIRVLFTLTLFFTATNCYAQTGSRPKRKAAKTRTRTKQPAKDEFYTSTVELPKGMTVPEPEWKREVGVVGVSHYKERDETNVSTGFEVYRRAPIMITLTFYFSVKGAEVVRPESVDVTAVANALVFAEDAGLVVEADGERFAFKPNTIECHERKCLNARAAVDFATFERIADSANVVIHAAPYTFELNEYGRGAMRDVVRAVESTPKKP